MPNAFPTMFSCPNGKQITLGGLYWVVYLVFMPFLVNLFTVFAFSTLGSAAIGSILSLLIDFLIIGAIFREYLKECWLFAGIHRKDILKAIATASGIVLAAEFLIQAGILLFSEAQEFMGGLEWLLMLGLFPPFIDMTGATFGSIIGAALGEFMGVFSILCNIFLPALTMSCMYYGVAFAPLAQKRPWLGYIAVLIIGFIVPFSYYWQSGVWDDCLFHYISRIPLYLCACWAYQKTDNIWAPIAVHGIVNLVFMLPALIIIIVRMM